MSHLRPLLAVKTGLFEALAINIIRDPLNGRNFECFTEDPLLNAKLAAAFVRGAQAQGVFADAKHLICNDQELNRNEVDGCRGERALREIYLPGFQAGSRAAPHTSTSCLFRRIRWRSRG